MTLLPMYGMSFACPEESPAGPAATNESPTFDEFRVLSKDERQAAIGRAEGYAKNRLLNLDHRVQAYERMGADAWRSLLEREVIYVRGFINLLNLFIEHKGVHSRYQLQEWRRKPTEKSEAIAHEIFLMQRDEMAQRVWKRASQLLAYIAPTEDAKRLEAEAGKLSRKLQRLFPQGVDVHVSEDDLAEVDRLAEEMIAKLEKLPRVKEQQQEADLKLLSERITVPRFF